MMIKKIQAYEKCTQQNTCQFIIHINTAKS